MIQIDKIRIAKGVATFIVGAGTTKIVKSIIQNNTDPEKLVDRVEIAAASVVIGAMAADATRRYTDNMIDELVKAVQDFKNRNVIVESEVVKDEA
jgi:hypothetical protein